jgi:hypothetical protein
MEYPESIGTFFKNLLSWKDFMPHGHCYLWRADIVWLHAVSDTVIAAAYYSIPCALVYFVAKRKDLVFSWIFIMFGIFILACGTTHVMDVWTLWQPVYRLDGLIRAFTACVSLLTAFMLWPLIPKALTIPSHTQLRSANENLAKEVEQRRHAEESMRMAHSDLELRVHQRTQELSLANISLQNEIGHRRTAEEALRQEKDQLKQINEMMLNREDRILTLKREVNELCLRLNDPAKYNV